ENDHIVPAIVRHIKVAFGIDRKTTRIVKTTRRRVDGRGAKRHAKSEGCQSLKPFLPFSVHKLFLHQFESSSNLAELLPCSPSQHFCSTSISDIRGGFPPPESFGRNSEVNLGTEGDIHQFFHLKCVREHWCRVCGTRSNFPLYPGLTSRANECRRFAAGLNET